MKHTLIILALSCVAAVAQTVEIRDPVTVLIDGQAAGKPFDTAANNRQLAPELQTALEAWWKAEQEIQAAALKQVQQEAETDKIESLRLAAESAKVAMEDIATKASAAIKDANDRAQAFITAAQTEVEKIQAHAKSEAEAISAAIEQERQTMQKAVNEATGEAQNALADKKAAEEKLRALVAALELGEPKIVEVELAAAKRSRQEDRKREIESFRKMLSEEEAALK